MRIAGEPDGFARLGVAAETVLRSVEGRQRERARRPEALDDALQIAGDAGLVRDQPDALAADEVEVFLKKDFDAEFHAGLVASCAKIPARPSAERMKKPRRACARRGS